MSHNEKEIIFEEISGAQGNLGVITLNRPRVLNALNHTMFLELDKHLQLWEEDKKIKAVVLKAAEGRAFCAGGDIRFAHERGKVNDPILPQFFRDEYKMNSRIFHFKKPYIAIMDGITMGGGAGISMHGSHRVVTPRFVFAMPETAIGLYPDVGATYFLPRLPHKFGFYLGLTGARANHDDCFALGLVTQIIKPESIEALIKHLAEEKFDEENAKVAISKIISQFAILPGPSELMTHTEEVQACFGKETIEEIIQTLREYSSDWCKQTAATLETKSPTSLKVTLKALQEGAKLSFDECMRMEYRLTNRFLLGNDFYEGVRAAIIDKDQKPNWKPNKLEDVNAKDIEKYFENLKEEFIL